jgi:hypothetical protein
VCKDQAITNGFSLRVHLLPEMENVPRSFVHAVHLKGLSAPAMSEKPHDNHAGIQVSACDAAVKISEKFS